MAEGINSSVQWGKKIRNRGSGQRKDPNAIHPSEYIEPVPVDHRKCRRTKSKIELNEKIQIVHQILIEHRPLRDVAKEHRVTASHISNIVSKVKKKPNLLSELKSEEELKQQNQ